MSHFRQGATVQESLLELISNQLQLASRQAERHRKDTHVDMANILELQIEALLSKILNQRAELKISVDGV